MSGCDKYNQYYTDLYRDGVLTSWCFNGDKIYPPDVHFNDYTKYENEKYYKWVNDNFKEYSYPPETNESPEEIYSSICESKTYSLKPQQKFAARIFNTYVPNNSMLIYHGLGSGKTQTSIIIGEAFKFKTVDNKIIPGREDTKVLIIVPVALKEQYYNEILGKFENGELKSATGQVIINGKRQFYLDSDINDALLNLYTHKENLSKEGGENPSIQVTNEIKKAEQQIIKFKNSQNTKIEKVYEIVSHETFLNRIFKFRDNFFEEGPFLEFLKKPNGLMIIDEIQNIISEMGSNYKKLLYAIKFYAHPTFRLVVLTGTPIYDKPFEFGLLMNLLRTRIVFPDNRTQFDSIFLNKEGQMDNIETFKMMCSGYVSYFKGGNPTAYPYKKTTIMYHEMKPLQYHQYGNVIEKEIKQAMKSRMKLDDIHNIAYVKNKEVSSGVFNKSNLFCNIAFPDSTRYTTNKISLLKASLAQFKDELKNQKLRNPNLNILEIVSMYSSKFAKIAEMVLQSVGTVFIYSNYVVYGVDALAIVMDAVGYAAYPKRGPMGSYFVWKGEADPVEVSVARKIFNSPNNIDGSLLKIMFGTQSVMEGVDFKNVRSIHIVDPWWNDSRLQQIIARGIRLCSHKDLPPDQRYVDVFIHLTTLNTSNHIYKGEFKGDKIYMESINNSVLDLVGIKESKSGDKEDRITIFPLNRKVNRNEVTNIQSIDPYIEFISKGLKDLSSISIQEYMYTRSLEKLNVNRQFEKAIKEVAIDCEINKNGNIIRLDEKYTPTRDGFYFLVYENYSTGETYVRSGVKSQFNPNLPENILTLQDILANVAKNTKNYTFTNTVTSQKITTKDLIIPENIKCDAVKYNFQNVPDSIKNITLNKQLLPYLMKMNPNRIYDYLYAVVQKNITPVDPGLPNKIKTFMSKSYVVSKHALIEKLTELGYEATEDIWDLYTLDELKNEYNNLSKIK